MKNYKYFLNESKHKFKKGDKVKIHPDWKDDPNEDDTYILLENPDGGRVKIKAIDSNLSFPPVEVVKLEWIIKESLNENGLLVLPSTTKDYHKLVKWLKTSDYDADINTTEKYIFFQEENVDSLEKELDKEFIKHDISVTYELQENVDNTEFIAYNDLSADDRKELDSYCKMQFGKQFLECSYDEQGAARSILWTIKNEPEEIDNQNVIDAKL